MSLHPEGNELGSEPAFGSRCVSNVQELALPHLTDIPPAQQHDVLVFDWWVHNTDRTLTQHGGNPNLLWNTQANALVVIDHNAAFDTTFDPHEFSRTHVFANQISSIFQDAAKQHHYAERLCDTLAVWPEACQNVPNEWWFADEERTVPTDFDPEAALAMLNRCTHEAFWTLAV